MKPNTSNNDEQKKATANWYITLDVDCPYCNETFDCLKVPDYYIDVLQSIELGRCKDNLDITMLCPKCNKEFKINETTQ